MTLRELSPRTYSLCITFIWHSGSFHRAHIVCAWLCMTLRELSSRTYCLCMTLYHTPGALTAHICLCMTLYDTTRALTAHILFVYDFVSHSGSSHRAHMFVYDFVWHYASSHRAHIVCVWLCMTLRELSPRTYCLCMTLYHTPGALTAHICLCMTLYDTTRALIAHILFVYDFYDTQGAFTAHILFVYDFVWHSGSSHRAHIACVWFCMTLRELTPRIYCLCMPFVWHSDNSPGKIQTSAQFGV